MILTAKKLSEEIIKGNSGDALGVSIIPAPDLKKLANSGEASVSLRLGRWFVTMRPNNVKHVKAIYEPGGTQSQRVAKQYFVPFGEEFVLHPGRFVLASTLEWIRLPTSCAALVLGKSTLARRGIIIETAAGVHPGFSGCLTLEVANVGEIPVTLVAGMMIGQLFVQNVHGDTVASKTELAGQRKPRLGEISEDVVLTKLIQTKR